MAKVHRLSVKSLIVITLCICLFALCFVYKTKSNFLRERKHSFTPKILLWTSFFGSDWNSNPEQVWQIKCRNNHIHVYQKAANWNLAEMDAVAFHWLDINLHQMPLEKYAHQKWALLNWESPPNQLTLLNVLENIQEKIDWTVSYLHDSDIFSPYGFVVKKSQANIVENDLFWSHMHYNDESYVEMYGHAKLGEQSGDVKYILKEKQIAWMVSHCNVASNREKFVQQLAKYIPVDIYGKCGKLDCPRDRKNLTCKRMVAEKYNFYLAFENSLCKDYCTEKLFDALRLGSLPIVFGGADYKQILPPNSFIDALSFKSVKDLADYLYLVSNNRSLYESYFNWKKEYLVFSNLFEASFASFLCGLGDAIVQRKPSRKDHNLVHWFFDDSKCWSWKLLKS